MANIIVYIIKHLHKLTADVLRSSPKEDNSLVFSMQCLRHRECKLNINNSDRMAGWRAVSRNPMSLHHLAIGRGGASWIALEPVRNKLIQAIFFRTKVSPVLFHHGDKMHRFKAFKYSKRARSVQVNKIHTIPPTLRLMRGATPELHELSSGA